LCFVGCLLLGWLALVVACCVMLVGASLVVCCWVGWLTWCLLCQATACPSSPATALAAQVTAHPFSKACRWYVGLLFVVGLAGSCGGLLCDVVCGRLVGGLYVGLCFVGCLLLDWLAHVVACRVRPLPACLRRLLRLFLCSRLSWRPFLCPRLSQPPRRLVPLPWRQC